MSCIFRKNYFIHRVNDDAMPPHLEDYKVDFNTQTYSIFHQWCESHVP